MSRDGHERALSKRFSGEAAQNYDARIPNLIPGYEALLQLAGPLLSARIQSPTARLLIGGVGTGGELLAIAEQEPRWSFLGLDPSEDMLKIAEARFASAMGAERPEIELVCSDIETWPINGRFDAGCSLFVSHFMSNAVDKLNYYRSLRSHLKPGAPALIAELTHKPQHMSAYGAWLQARQGAVRAMQTMASIKNDLHPMAPKRFRGLLKRAGFTRFQTVAVVLGYEMLIVE